MEFRHCWEFKDCDRPCPVKESQSLFCWKIARTEGFQQPEACEKCDYRRAWIQGEYTVSNFIRKSERRRQRRDARRILVVDDEPNILYALEETVRSEGYDCLSAIDGEEGLFLARQLQPDLVISDVIMPKVNGYELCQAIKYEPGTRHIPVILVTVRGMTHDITLGESVGADAYLIKPFHSQELSASICALLKPR